MGISIFGKSSSSGQDPRRNCCCGGTPSVSPVTQGGNPNPSKFKITHSFVHGEWVGLRVNYPDARNYEGDKILVYRGHSLASLQQAKVLDPHFLDTGIHPFARFTPTPAGWSAARTFIEAMIDNY